jgi:hypothetical protein
VRYQLMVLPQLSARDKEIVAEIFLSLVRAD